VLLEIAFFESQGTLAKLRKKSGFQDFIFNLQQFSKKSN
jgi:hypothetical protein